MLVNSSLQTILLIEKHSELALKCIAQLENSLKQYLDVSSNQTQVFTGNNFILQKFGENCVSRTLTDEVQKPIDSSEYTTQKNLSQELIENSRKNSDVNDTIINYCFLTYRRTKNTKNRKKRKSRVYNSDSLLKKIKAKYLKYLYITLKKCLKLYPRIQLKKLNQIEEVRNIDIKYNQSINNLTILNFLKKNKAISEDEYRFLFSIERESACWRLLNKRIKSHFHFDFLKSEFYRNWMRDPSGLYSQGSKQFENRRMNSNCLKYKNYSKNVFRNGRKYEHYKSLLFNTCCNYIFYFQNSFYV